MRANRRNRLVAVLFIFVGSAGAVALMLMAANENLNLFHPPGEIVSGTAPIGVPIRAGGMVLEGSVARAPDSLDVEFVLTDYQGSNFSVAYSGILPDLFREEQGILVRGELDADGVFQAVEVLAKHDENYMPPELIPLMEHSQEGRGAVDPTPDRVLFRKSVPSPASAAPQPQ